MLRLVAIAVVVLGFGFVVFAGDGHSATAGCKARVFQTQLVKDACTKGGQPAAKAAMKQFMKDVSRNFVKDAPRTKGAAHRPQELTCNSCHTRLAPNYPLTADGLNLFKRLGGR